MSLLPEGYASNGLPQFLPATAPVESVVVIPVPPPTVIDVDDGAVVTSYCEVIPDGVLNKSFWYAFNVTYRLTPTVAGAVGDHVQISYGTISGVTFNEIAGTKFLTNLTGISTPITNTISGTVYGRNAPIAVKFAYNIALPTNWTADVLYHSYTPVAC